MSDTPDRVVWCVLAYLRAVHAFLDWAPVGSVPKRETVIAWRRERAKVRREAAARSETG